MGLSGVASEMNKTLRALEPARELFVLIKKPDDMISGFAQLFFVASGVAPIARTGLKGFCKVGRRAVQMTRELMTFPNNRVFRAGV